MDATGKSKTTLSFTVTSAAGTRQEVVTQDIVKIGKDPKSHLRLDDETASRMHAVVEVAGVDDITLIDLGNEPGTLVNGQRINKCKIKAGDEVRIADTRIVLNSAVPAAEAAARLGTQMGMAPPPPASGPPVNPFAAAAPAANPFAGAAAPAANPFAAAAPTANPFAGGAVEAPNPFGGGSPFANAFGSGHGHASAAQPDDPNAEYTYRLVKSGPEVSSDEVENSHIPAVEVMILWDSTILHVAHLTPPRSYYVGEDEGGKNSKGFQIPAEKLGTTRMPVVVASGGSISAVVPPGAKGSIDVPGQGKMTLEEARAKGMLRPSSEVAGGEEIPLSNNARSRVEINGFVFQVAAVAAGKKPGRALNKSSRATAVFWVASAALHAGIITALMMSPGESLDDESAGLDKSTQAYMLQLQKNSADKEIPEQEDTAQQNPQNDQKAGGTGTRHKGAEGMMGDPSKNMTGGYYQIKGPPDTAEVKIAKTRALIESGNYGAIGALSSVFGSTANAPIAFDSDSNETIGRDPNNFNGNLMGDHPGDSFGYGGLGMTGTGPGGGGWGDGIGLGTVGGFGHGAGTGTGMGYGGGGGRVGSGRKTKTVKMIETGTDIQGRLPPEVIKRIIRANFPRFRACYEQGLKKDPGLKGTVSVRFIIDMTGAVESASLSGGSMSDGQVSGCVLGVYRTLSFPEPEGGKVMVTYPIDFQNED
jgi:hypothetical protein